MAEIDKGYDLYKEGIQYLGSKNKPTEDFKRRLFDLFMENIDLYRCKPLPTPPQVVQELHAKQLGDKDYQVKDDFWRQGAVHGWLEARNAIVGQNRGNYGHLVEKCHSPFASTEQKNRISGMMKEFTTFFEDECKRCDYRPLLPTQDYVEIEKVDITQDILDIADIFGGEIV